jgi:RNA polymerase nonessential primary-like sigma factor
MTNGSAAPSLATIQPELGDLSWVASAHRFLSFALRYDYLSTGRGHQQSHRVIGERIERAQSLKKAAPATASPAGRTGGKSASQADAERAYMNKVATIRRISSREEYGLAKRIQAGSETARNELVEANLGLTVLLARRYQRSDIPFLELVAEGNLGLFAATRSFDPELGFRFSTYAKWAVRQSIERALPRFITVRQGTSKSPASQAQRQVGEDLHLFDNSQCLDETEAGEPVALGDSPHTVMRPQEERPHHTMAMFGQVSDEEALSSLPIPEEEEPQQTTHIQQRNISLQRALDRLSERERTVVTERYGLVNEQTATLEELSHRFGVSIERVRQIECAAVRKLAELLTQAGETAESLL